jgi:hypothetical protein
MCYKTGHIINSRHFKCVNLVIIFSLCYLYVYKKRGGDIMPRSATNMLDISELPAAERREMRDFFQFLLTHRASTKKHDATYRFSDLCGTVNWQGDAVATQRSLRDEW